MRALTTVYGLTYLGSKPSSPNDGDTYYDTTENITKVYSGYMGQWIDIESAPSKSKMTLEELLFELDSNPELFEQLMLEIRRRKIVKITNK